MPSFFSTAYWGLAGMGMTWAAFVGLLMNPTFQRHILYAHKIPTNIWSPVKNPESLGFAKGQVQPFWLDTTDGEKLFCWHVLPLDVYLKNEYELVKAASEGEVAEELKGTIGEKLLKGDEKSTVVVNFHGNLGHVAQGYRPATYHSVAGIPNAHLITCDYRGFGLSTLKNPPHIPTETGLITDAISLVSYIQNNLNHPSTRTILLGQSLGTAVTAATALYFADPDSHFLPTDLAHPSPKPSPNTFSDFAGVILIAPFTDLPRLLRTYNIGGIIPILKPLRPYPRIYNWVSAKILDHWPTLARLQALLSADSLTSLHLTMLHARNDADISFRESEALFAPLESAMLAEEGASATEERRSIHGGDRVKHGAFAYRKVENAKATRTVEVEVVRFGGHNEVMGWVPVNLAVRRAVERTGMVHGEAPKEEEEEEEEEEERCETCGQ